MKNTIKIIAVMAHIYLLQLILPDGGVALAIGPWVAAAASLMLLLFLTLPGEKQPTISVAKISPMDINEDGQVDILDAFTLASRIEHRTLEEKWDINGDGQVDQADVEEISAFAVKLGPEDKS